jgi:HD-GYP domain-containing protein (c-di-GMP phosphodiesterase class II)/phosphoribosyl 1,2-cyclic phosphodiesterase
VKHTRSLDANEILELIFRYLTKVSSLRNYDDIINVLADMGRALTSSDRCSVWVVSDDKKTIWTKVAQGINRVELSIDSGIVGASIISGEKILIDDVYDDSRFNSEIDKQTGYLTKSMMVIPMFDNEHEIIGAFQVINNRGKKGVFDTRDMERLMLASTYAAETLVSAKLAEEIEETQREVVFTMGAVGESRSKETGNHVKRVAEYSKILALAYGMSEEEAELLKQASPMHDIGKVAIADSILNKPGRFNKQEREIMNTHAKLGYEMTNTSHRKLLKAASIVSYEHHEKWDGTGYPRGKSGEDIHIYGRITAIADVFDALGSDRVYKKKWDDSRIIKFFKDEKGKHFDPKLTELFFENLDKFFEIRDKFKDKFQQQTKIKQDVLNSIKVLGAYGSKAKDFGTSSFYLNSKNMIDAGNILAGLEEKSAEIEHIWITHSHLDHILDIAYIIDNYYADVKKTIVIHALAETIQMIKEHFFNNLIWPDFSNIPLSNNDGMCIEYAVVELDIEYKISDVESIKAFKTDHTVASCGYIYTKNEKSILITADTYSLSNIIDILNNDKKITTAIIECSFPSNLDILAKESKHLTPKLLKDNLNNLQRDDINICINHIKPFYLEIIEEEISLYCDKWHPKILKDDDILQF